MYFVYILRSVSHPDQIYVGFLEDIVARVKKHNEAGNVSTARCRPWKLIFYCAFGDKRRALAFESYLKSHSGKAFSAKRLL
ncbi:MAG: GIY-YIG nuclease family protein [Kiritimatiellae bacterium]|nr:GIY-YIG nuclease family protein [Kiritimatiellia bacterium]MDD5520903.1 GIY-YIG nuclease family protein [Kiritimatiellia bacterium]